MSRRTLRDLLIDEGYETVEEMCVDLMDSGDVPAMCSECCRVEPDGRCEHGYPSVFLALGLI